MEGPDPSTDAECMEHGAFKTCTKPNCGASYCDQCNPYIMERGRGLCPTHGARAYADELYADYFEETYPSVDAAVQDLTGDVGDRYADEDFRGE